VPVGAVDARRDGDGARRHVVRDARGEVDVVVRYFDVDGQTYGHSSFDKSVPAAWATGFAELLDLKLKYTGLTGPLPDLNFSRMADCGMKRCCETAGAARASRVLIFLS